MKKEKTIKQFIKLFLETRGKYYEAYEGMKVKDVLQNWMNGEKLYDPQERYHMMYDSKELWPYREYTWTRETAAGLEVKSSISSKTYLDKWKFLPDHMGNTGATKWDLVYEDMKKNGWDKKDPAYVEIGKNGKAKVGEGNHRLSIAKELGIKVPVFFIFKQEVVLDSMSNV